MTCRCDPFTGDECQSCKNKVLIDKAEYERLQRLEKAAIEWAQHEAEFLRNNSADKWAAFCMAGKGLKTECRKAAEKARTE